MSYDSKDVLERCKGRWDALLEQFGVDSSFLRKRKGPCPMCGGSDRFTYDNNFNRGTWFCQQCGNGDGLELLRLVRGWDFKTALEEVAKVVGGISDDRVTKEPKRSDPRPALREAWKGSKTDMPEVGEYLFGRGLSVVPEMLRYHPGMKYYHDGKMQGSYPVMLAPVSDDGGQMLSLHRTYLGDVPVRKKMMSPIKNINGATIKLFEAGPVMGIAEGIETAIAAHQMFNVPVWSTINANGMEAFEPPEGTETLMIFADNDMSYTGQKVAYTLANRLAVKRKMDCHVYVPDHVDHDWLDEMNARVEEAA